MLHEKGRFTLLRDASSWRDALLREGLTEIPVDPGPSPPGRRAPGHARLDPADRLIVATALEGHRLVTGDQRLPRLAGTPGEDRREGMSEGRGAPCGARRPAAAYGAGQPTMDR